MKSNFFTIQEFILPRIGSVGTDNMYVRLSEQTNCLYGRAALRLYQGGKAEFDTYFNGLSVGAIRRTTFIDSLFLTLQGHGRVVARIGLHRWGQSDRWLIEMECELPLSEPLEIPIRDIDDGMLYLVLEAAGDAEFTGASFLTDTQPANDVRLGIVITHFNRQNFVLPAIKRIQEGLLNHPEYRDNIELIVVDNSSNLDVEPAHGITVVPNQNFGGSGGFTRGLLYLMDAKSFTHCLFMDDDASCEIESIRRAFMLQRYARLPQMAISGALLREVEPYRLFEQGGIYRGNQLAPRYHGRDVQDIGTLLHLERDEIKTDYGAWWFFCFRIDQVKVYPFPFFVRGDDALFSLLNDFEVETFNGIACWGEDFQLKENPTTRYLGLRSTLAILLMNAHASKLTIFKLLLNWFTVSLMSYNYASAEAICMAIEDVEKGPEFWRENMDMALVRAKLAPLNAREKMVPLRLSQYHWSEASIEEPRYRRWIRWLTLNGFLLPNPFIRNILVKEEKGFRAVMRRVFRAREVLYVYEPLNLGYLAVHDKRAAFAAMRHFIKAVRSFLRHKDALEQAYKTARPDLTSESFWRGVYKEK